MDAATYIAVGVLNATLFIFFGYLTPRVTRPQLLFGVQIDPNSIPPDLPTTLRRKWDIGLLVIFTFALVLIAFTTTTPHPLWLVAQLLIALAWFFRLYLKLYRQALPYAAPASTLRPVELPMRSYSDIVPLVFEALPLALLVGSLVTSLLYYTDLPARIPIHFNLAGQPDGWTDKSLAVVFGLWVVNALLYAMLTLICVYTPRSSRLATRPSMKQSLAVRRRFIEALIRYLFVTKTLVVAVLALAHGWTLAAALDASVNLGIIMAMLGIVTLLVAIGGAIRLAITYGQGGSRLLKASDEHLEGSAADQSAWRLGVFYYNPNDPSLFVEKRFGIGLTLNFGNKKAWLFLGLIVLLLAIALTISFQS